MEAGDNQQQRASVGSSRDFEEAPQSQTDLHVAWTLEEAARAEALKLRGFDDDDVNNTCEPVVEPEVDIEKQESTIGIKDAEAARTAPQRLALEEASRAELLKIQTFDGGDNSTNNPVIRPERDIENQELSVQIRDNEVQTAQQRTALEEAARAEALKIQTFHDKGNSPAAKSKNQDQALALEEAARAEALKLQTFLDSNNKTNTPGEIDVDDFCLDIDHQKGQLSINSGDANVSSPNADKALALLEAAHAEALKNERLLDSAASTTGKAGIVLHGSENAGDGTNSATLPTPGMARARPRPTSRPGAIAVSGPGLEDLSPPVEGGNQLEDVESPPPPINDSNDEGLVEAQRINESQQFLLQAMPVRESKILDNSSNNRSRDKKTLAMLGGMFLLVVIVSVVVVVLVVSNKPSDEDTNSSTTTTNNETMAPTPTPYIINLPDYTLDVLNKDVDGATPQYQAYQWLTEGPNLESYSQERLLQRFALACLYYSTKGDGWYKGAQTETAIPSNSNNTGSNGNSSQRLLHLDGRNTAKRYHYPESYLRKTPRSMIEIESPKLPEDSPDPTLSGGPCGGGPPAGGPPAGGPPGGGPPGGGPPGGGPPGGGPPGGGLPPDGSCGQGVSPPRPILGQSTGGGSAWLSYSDDECDWFTGNPPGSATCDEDGMYVRLNLSANNLEAAALPRELALLSHLKLVILQNNDKLGGTLHGVWFESWYQINVLNIEHSSLRGTIPHEIGLCNNSLVELVLMKNEMTGVLPASLFRLTRLDSLRLGRNQFSGSLPGSIIPGLESLRDFVLDSSNFDGSIPTEIGLMTNLRIFSTHENSFSGTIPSEIGRLTNLVHLTLGDELEGIIPSELGLLRLGGFSVRHNERLSGTIPEELGSQSIQHLYLDGTNLTGAIPDPWCNSSILAVDCSQLCGCDCPSCDLNVDFAMLYTFYLDVHQSSRSS
ncbi:LRR receptor-like serine threonine-protein kinase [Seminavis robusta]|uniref:LRR receptor-like serine threonine-protein kinase n=1 Tax=Seminavis robusta TaxID=568900 RepID=A0A9N8HD94_9STRA|nr:LRR receptor-like serine threonine-protein kinase [Seminavis robusta]|eukprot:Sro334_g119700.1 LRR receptor-like serine threonine-protein kinase (945) ;mRNA; r:13408-16594